jgi:hypothetical protein
VHAVRHRALFIGWVGLAIVALVLLALWQGRAYVETRTGCMRRVRALFCAVLRRTVILRRLSRRESTMSVQRYSGLATQSRGCVAAWR